MSLESALLLLARQETWQKAAAAIIPLHDTAAVVPLVRAYESRAEGGRGPLLEALRASGAAGAAPALLASADPAERAAGAHVCLLLPGEQFVPLLERAIADVDERVRFWARRALAGQRQTPEWEEAMIRLLRADAETRALAAELLGRRKSERAQAALRAAGI